MAKRYRTRGHYLAAEAREALSSVMLVIAAAGGLVLLAGIARSLGLIH